MQSSDWTTEDLVDFLQKTFVEPAKQEQTVSRYIIYVRRSSEESDRQVRSFADQLAECREYAERLGIRPVQCEIVTESHSAKESGKRVKFQYVMHLL